MADMPVPPIALPKLPIFPIDAPAAALDQWFRLADLHAREAQRVTYWAASSAQSEATTKLASANTAMAGAVGETAAKNEAAWAPTIDKTLAAWTAHDGALDRLTAALAELPQVGGGSGGGGISSADFVAILTSLLKALSGKP
jgi:hypothetical protein